MPRGENLDLVGCVFGSLTVLLRAEMEGRTGKGFPSWWMCRCSCGAERVIAGRHLRSGATLACGVAGHTRAREIAEAAGGLVSHTPEYRTWVRIKQRCNNPKNGKFPYYGGRGIRVCDAWSDFHQFRADMGLRPSPKHSIEREDVNGNYEPNNCVWATNREQSRNRRDTVWVEYRGVKMKLIDLADDLGLNGQMIAGRLRIGWDLERAVTTPSRGWTKKPLARDNGMG